MRPGDWVDVEEIFAAALELAPPERAALLDRLCAGRPDARVEVESLLNSHDQAGEFLRLPPEPVQGLDQPPARNVTGTVVGAFRLLEPIGRGGMGAVFRAERADAAFTQRIAVKLIDAPLGNQDSLVRFRSERQILATLNHPHIVTLLDAGVTDLGQAFLAMEFVDGVAITTYCADHRLSLADRVRLVQLVCGAVQYAHRHGVVHRDLKPANVLVTKDGAPKVLDFGIAKLTDPSSDARDSTVTGLLRPLTPNYASPEQLRGLALTTASDIYSLGVLLYEIVAGVRPYDTTNKTLDDVLQIVVHQEPRRPSMPDSPESVLPYSRSQLAGDLDAIVLKAMDKDPSRRYASAQELAEDLGRHLSGQPVFAREASAGYVLARIARRHRAAFVASAVSLAALLVALGVSVWQARIAIAERNRAAERFSDVRQLAHALIFEIETEVRPLAGSTPVRQMIVAKALTYLEQLSRDPSGDDGLRIELAGGYRRIGDVQGRPSVPNLGDRAGARVSYQKGIDLVRPLVAGAQSSREAVIEFVNLHLSLAGVVQVSGSAAEARTAVNDATEVARSFVDRNPKDDEARRLLGSSYFQLALLKRWPDSLAEWQKAGAVFDGLLADKPEDPDRQRNVALVQKYLGGYYERVDIARALTHHLRAQELDEKRLAANPANRTAQGDVAIDLGNVAFAQWKTNQLPAAAAGYGRSLEIRKRLAASDPKDELARSRVAFVESKLSGVYRDMGRFAEALEHARAAVQLSESSPARDAGQQQHLAEDLQNLGLAEVSSGRSAAACQTFRRALSILTGLAANADLDDGLTQRARKSTAEVNQSFTSVPCRR